MLAESKAISTKISTHDCYVNTIALLANGTSVSYTHLDVYKRQSYGFTNSHRYNIYSLKHNSLET